MSTNLDSLVKSSFWDQCGTQPQNGWTTRLISLFGTLLGTRHYTWVQTITKHPFPDNLHIHSKECYASTWADWATIANRPGNKTKMEAAHHSLQWNSILFSKVNSILLSYLFILVLSVSWKLLTPNIGGGMFAHQKRCLISPIWMCKRLSSAFKSARNKTCGATIEYY